MTGHAQFRFVHFLSPWTPAMVINMEVMNEGLPHPRMCSLHRTRTRCVQSPRQRVTILMQMAHVMLVISIFLALQKK